MKKCSIPNATTARALATGAGHTRSAMLVNGTIRSAKVHADMTPKQRSMAVGYHAPTLNPGAGRMTVSMCADD
jgi:hypothetical protein